MWVVGMGTRPAQTNSLKENMHILNIYPNKFADSLNIDI
jgi:hypothetical protein